MTSPIQSKSPLADTTESPPNSERVRAVLQSPETVTVVVTAILTIVQSLLRLWEELRDHPPQ